MAVTRDFSRLNVLRPNGAVFGEVVAISAYVSLHKPGNLNPVAWESFGYTKRKSVHVPPSTNAYWNAMALFAEVNRFVPGEDAASRGVRSELKDCLCKSVMWIHEQELMATYHGNVFGVKSFQYYEVFLTADAQGWEVDIHVDDLLPSDDGVGSFGSVSIFKFRCEFPLC